MKLSLSPNSLNKYVIRLINHYLPDSLFSIKPNQSLFDKALQRVENCFSHIHRKYYLENGNVIFNHLNSDHMASLLYFYANTVWRETTESDLPTRLFYLNKIMHGLDLFYSVNMPDIFILVHPVGTVIGNAVYNNYLVIYQNCTIGSNLSVYPSLGEGIILYSRSSVIGNCNLGNNVIMAANAMLIDTDVPDSTLITGSYPNHQMSANRQPVRSRCFD